LLLSVASIDFLENFKGFFGAEISLI